MAPKDREEEKANLLVEIRQWWEGLDEIWSEQPSAASLLDMIMCLKLGNPLLYKKLDPGFEKGIDGPPVLVAMQKIYADLVMYANLGGGLKVEFAPNEKLPGFTGRIVGGLGEFQFDFPTSMISMRMVRAFIDSLKVVG